MRILSPQKSSRCEGPGMQPPAGPSPRVVVDVPDVVGDWPAGPTATSDSIQCRTVSHSVPGSGRTESPAARAAAAASLSVPPAQLAFTVASHMAK